MQIKNKQDIGLILDNFSNFASGMQQGRSFTLFLPIKNVEVNGP